MKRTTLFLLSSLLCLSQAAKAQTNEVWFDQPTTLNGQQCWWKGQDEEACTRW